MDRQLDAALRLLDRQIIDSEGRMVGKVDDLEMIGSGADLRVGRLLTGAAAWLPRISRPLARQWMLLAPAEPDRDHPWSIPLELLDDIDSAVHLSVPRDGMLRRVRATHRLSQLLGMRVIDPAGRRLGVVTDVRLLHRDGLRATRLIVGRRHPGALLGYHQHPGQGPWAVRVLMRRLARHNREFDTDDTRIDWAAGTVRITSASTGAR